MNIADADGTVGKSVVLLRKYVVLSGSIPCGGITALTMQMFFYSNDQTFPRELHF